MSLILYTRNTILAVPLALGSNLCIKKYPHLYAGCWWENTRKSSKSRAVLSQHLKCLHKVHDNECFYKLTEPFRLCKNYLSKWSSSKLSQKLSNRALIQSESSTEVLTCIRGQVWSQHENIDAARERNFALVLSVAGSFSSWTETSVSLVCPSNSKLESNCGMQFPKLLLPFWPTSRSHVCVLIYKMVFEPIRTRVVS